MLSNLGTVEFIFALLIAFQIKHWIGDYLLQTGWMVRGKARPGIGFILPLAVHVGVHAAMTLAIVMVIDKSMWWLALVDFGAHYAMDRIKSAPGLLGRFADVTKQSFWIPLGLDQMVHHLTHYAIIYVLLTRHIGG